MDERGEERKRKRQIEREREREREREKLSYLIKTGLYVVGRGLSYICNHQPGTIDIY